MVSITTKFLQCLLFCSIKNTHCYGVPCKCKKVRLVRNFLRHFLTTFWKLQTAFLIFEIMAILAVSSGAAPFLLHPALFL